MRRFSRRRRGGASSEGRAAPIDAERWLGRIRDEGVLPLADLEVAPHEDVPDAYAALMKGKTGAGETVWVAFSPRHAGDAVLAGLAIGGRLAEDESFSGEVLAVSPQWSIEARRRLGLIRAELPYQLRPVAASALADAPGDVESEAALEPSVTPVQQVGAQLADASARELFARAATALEGLASKHGGSLRGVGRGVELVLLARRVAELRADESGLALNTLQPQRSTVMLTADNLAGTLDGLEGQLRRRINDRRLREGEEGMRTSVLPLLASARSLRDVVAWPLGGTDRDEIDLVGLDAEGHPVVGVSRTSLSISELGSILDATQRLRVALPGLLGGAAPPVRIEAPRLLIAAQEFGGGTLRALAGLSLAHELFEIRAARGDGFEIVAVSAGEATRSIRDPQPRSRRRGGRSAQPVAADAAGAEEDTEAEGKLEEAASADTADGARRRGRRRGRGRGRAGAPESGRRDEQDGQEEGESKPRPRFEEMSLFDVDDGASSTEGSEEGDGNGNARRGRTRSRRRGRRSSGGTERAEAGGDSGATGEDEEDDDPQGPPRGRGRRRGRGDKSERPAAKPARSDNVDDDLEDDDEDLLAELPEELAPVAGARGPAYADEETEGDEADEGAKKRVVEREKRRMARKAKKDVEEAPKPVRRRAVVVAHADRDSLLGAILLARDIRLLEGIWIYPQEELMNFFRGVATDLREDVPIHLVGFVPKPARDIAQAAALYRNRLTWYDHHEWPPEDRAAIVDALGAEALHHHGCVGSSLPGVLETSTRRSRFSDKLVDLATGRFSQHDFERWGRLWWWRLAEIAKKSGDVRADVDPLLNGRPSDLAKEAALVEAPPIPEEVSYVSERDFRLVHFAGYSMIVTSVPPGLEPHLVGRVARERYGAQLSLSYREGEGLMLFGGEELSGRRVLDFGALAEHLADKLDWVEALPDNDHVARFHIMGLDAHPGRLDEVIGEIAMGRSILER